MPAYSFKERFIPLIKSGEKKQTIRKKRKGQAKPGSTLYLYYGMRTKWCTKIKETVCKDVKEIRITKRGDVYLNGERLSEVQKDILAWCDGFRAEDSKISIGCFEVMLRWWKQTHELPFTGDIIYW
ncbi:MAG: hypothetical protein J0M30_14720 [Chitinophagales bacterium]|nr:hypothetical protein [Chitinophagales bacterium]